MKSWEEFASRLDDPHPGVLKVDAVPETGPSDARAKNYAKAAYLAAVHQNRADMQLMHQYFEQQIKKIKKSLRS